MRAILIVAAVAGACISAGSDPPGEEGEVQPGEAFEIRMGEEKRLPEEELAVRFVSVVADSRCPRDVTCIWEGDAEIEVALSRAGEQATLRLHTHADRARRAAALGCSLDLESLDPYPQTSDPIEPSDYSATLVVTLGDGGEDPASR